MSVIVDCVRVRVCVCVERKKCKEMGEFIENIVMPTNSDSIL